MWGGVKKWNHPRLHPHENEGCVFQLLRWGPWEGVWEGFWKEDRGVVMLAESSARKERGALNNKSLSSCCSYFLYFAFCLWYRDLFSSFYCNCWELLLVCQYIQVSGVYLPCPYLLLAWWDLLSAGEILKIANTSIIKHFNFLSKPFHFYLKPHFPQ